MTLSQPALDAARDAYDSAEWAYGSDQAIAAAIEAYLKDVSRSGSAKDAFLSFCDPSNWNHDRKKGAYYSGWKDATDSIMEMVLEFWPELAMTALPTPPRAPAAETAEQSDADVIRLCGDDAAAWAAEFCKTAKKLGYGDIDEGWMIGWFANAIETAHDKRVARAVPAAETAEPELR
jgi:hypothetical protein